MKLFHYAILSLSFIVIISAQGDRFAAGRKSMVESQLQERNITDAKVLSVMELVPIHLFVPEEYQNQAYDDHPLPIGYEQTISQPYIVALMTQELHLKPEEKVLEIGTGSGYQAAVLSEIVKEVYTIEIIPGLAKEAAERLETLGYKNIKVRHGDGFEGWEEFAPFDAIIITAAAPLVPEPLIDQLSEGGRLIMPLGNRRSLQNLILVTKKNGKTTMKSITEVIFVPMTGKVEGEEP